MISELKQVLVECNSNGSIIIAKSECKKRAHWDYGRR